MIRTDILYLIIGESGTGKDTVVNQLCNQYGFTRVKSFTTRPSRNTSEDNMSHIFINDSEMNDLMLYSACDPIVAYTEYNGYRYCVCGSFVNDASLYIIDPDGVDYFKAHYLGVRTFKIINLYTSSQNRISRMKGRGDNEDDIKKRVTYDVSAFKNIKADIRIKNEDLDTCVQDVYHYILEQERKMIV